MIPYKIERTPMSIYLILNILKIKTKMKLTIQILFICQISIVFANKLDMVIFVVLMMRLLANKFIKFYYVKSLR